MRDRREEVREQDERYWREAVLRRHLALEPSLASKWTQQVLSGFVEYQLGRIPAKRLALTLSDHVQRIQVLANRFGSLEEITSERFLACYSPEEMRRSQSLLDYLHSEGVKTPSRDQRMDLAEERRIANLLERVEFSSHAPLVRRFRAALLLPNRRGLVPRMRSQRSSLSAACGWITLAADDGLTQDSLDRYLRQTPGQRAALSTFIGFLCRNEGKTLCLPTKSGEKKGQLSRREGDEALGRCLSILGDDGADFASRRAALAGVLVGLLAIPLSVVIRLPRGAVTRAGQGQLSVALPTAAPTGVSLDDPRITVPVGRYLSDRDHLVGQDDGFLFPGRPLYQHITECALAARLKSLGAPVRVLSMSGSDWIKGQASASLLAERAAGSS